MKASRYAYTPGKAHPASAPDVLEPPRDPFMTEQERDPSLFEEEHHEEAAKHPPVDLDKNQTRRPRVTSSAW